MYYLLVEEDPEPWKDEEDMPELEENDLDEIIRKCWVREFGSMDEVVKAVKMIVAQEGLELSGEDDIMVDASVERFEAAGIFSNMIKRFEESSA